MSGNYGDLRVCVYDTEISNSSFRHGRRRPGQTPVLTSLLVCSTTMWAFNGLKVQSLAAAAHSTGFLG